MTVVNTCFHRLSATLTVDGLRQETLPVVAPRVAVEHMCEMISGAKRGREAFEQKQPATLPDTTCHLPPQAQPAIIVQA